MNFVCIFSLRFSKIKTSPKYPKIEKVTDRYQVLYIRLSPLTVAFHSKNDMIIEIMHHWSVINLINIDFLIIPENSDFWFKTLFFTTNCFINGSVEPNSNTRTGLLCTAFQKCFIENLSSPNANYHYSNYIPITFVLKSCIA